MQVFTPKSSRKERYAEYLHSDHWKSLSASVRIKAGNKCEACGGPPSHVHHINYRSWYDCVADDLVCLCSECHQSIHRAYKQYKTTPEHYSRAETIAIIQQFRGGMHQPSPSNTKKNGMNSLKFRVKSVYMRYKNRLDFNPNALREMIRELSLIQAQEELDKRGP